MMKLITKCEKCFIMYNILSQLTDLAPLNIFIACLFTEIRQELVKFNQDLARHDGPPHM